MNNTSVKNVRRNYLTSCNKWNIKEIYSEEEALVDKEQDQLDELEAELRFLKKELISK